MADALDDMLAYVDAHAESGDSGPVGNLNLNLTLDNVRAADEILGSIILNEAIHLRIRINTLQIYQQIFIRMPKECDKIECERNDCGATFVQGRSCLDDHSAVSSHVDRCESRVCSRAISYFVADLASHRGAEEATALCDFLGTTIDEVKLIVMLLDCQQIGLASPDYARTREVLVARTAIGAIKPAV